MQGKVELSGVNTSKLKVLKKDVYKRQVYGISMSCKAGRAVTA